MHSPHGKTSEPAPSVRLTQYRHIDNFFSHVDNSDDEERDRSSTLTPGSSLADAELFEDHTDRTQHDSKLDTVPTNISNGGKSCEQVSEDSGDGDDDDDDYNTDDIDNGKDNDGDDEGDNISRDSDVSDVSNFSKGLKGEGASSDSAFLKLSYPPQTEEKLRGSARDTDVESRRFVRGLLLTKELEQFLLDCYVPSPAEYGDNQDEEGQRAKDKRVSVRKYGGP